MSVVTATPPAGIANANQPNSRKVLLSVRDVLKVYGSREAVTRALDDVSFDICEGEFVGVMGPSGSGKSTLLNCISTIDTVTSGSIILNGRDITQLRSRQLSKFRRDDLGFIFQDANLLDTLTAHKDGCVGMAANMIGVRKRIIAFDNEGSYMVMFNPEIVKKSGAYEAEEGCLSLTGTRKTRRWQSIKVQYQNEKMQIRLKTFTGWTAQIIQHEIDHCNGIII